MIRLRPLLAALAVTAALAGACSSGDDATQQTSNAAAVGGSTPRSVPPSTSTTLPPLRDFAVGEHHVELVDASRPTMAAPNRGLPEEPDRTIPVLVLYPAEGEADATITVTKEAPAADGVFPLVVFSHGVTGTGDVYLGRLKRWARKGYIVAAPTYPRTSGPGAEIHDYVNQPDDISFVIEELLLRAEEPDHLLHDRLDGADVAVAGHSLGAITTVGAAYNTCCRDERIDAAVTIAGIELPFPDGSYDWPDLPLLAIHGGKDGTLPIGGSEALVAKAGAPSYFLRFPDAGHTDVLIGPTGDLLDDAVVAFLDRYLKDDPRRLDALPEAVAASGLGSLEVNDPDR